MKIAIFGTRGIPNHHGGFEQFADYFSRYLKDNGVDVYVYCSSLHPYKESQYQNVNLIHCFDAEDKIGTAGQFVYDLNCILDARRRNFDLILQLGYTSSSIWHFLMPKKAVIVTNMDGLEWKRSKYSKPVRKFLKYAESLAARNSDFLIADSIGIQQHLKETYNKNSEYIAYGADIFDNPDEDILTEYGLKPYAYDLLIARMEPENNIETIIKSYLNSSKNKKLCLVGNPNGTPFGKYLVETYGDEPKLRFLGGIYNHNALDNLRHFSDLYFHGHSVGGTNPSLLEAMASQSFIIAHDNIFNRSILQEDAFYFKNEEELTEIINKSHKLDPINTAKILHNGNKIKNQFSWEIINKNYLNYLKKCLR